ncbi:hypothetical protein KP509_30G048600 [Ceratopteris richardii]|nr:hypothetical protein KP509_30G048600 [Ceratopteris richardii]
MVLPPSSTDRRKANYNLGSKEEALFNSSKDSRKWPFGEDEHVEKNSALLFENKDLKHVTDAQPATTENMKRDEEEQQIEASNQGVQGERQVKGLPSCGPLLQWGHHKRSRCSRVDGHNLKPCTSADDSSVLFRKTIRVQADKTATNLDQLASKASIKAKNCVVIKKEQLQVPRTTTQIHAHPHREEKNKQIKLAKNGMPDMRQERKSSPLAGSKRDCPPTFLKQEHQKKACLLPDPKSSSQDACVPRGGVEPNSARVELVWPKFIITLSRKEKEEDFLIMKGSKLPQRPKRRPKAVERVLHYCSPGSWLVDMSHTRYDVREKKRIKKRPRGLKAMESVDSDSE